MGMIPPDSIDHELYRIGALQMLEQGKPKEAASLTYQWLLKESLPAEQRPDDSVPNLYHMLSYLIERGETFGFTIESKLEKEGVVFVIRNNKLQKSRAIPILLELLLAHICEHLCDVEGEITQSGTDTIVRIKLPQ